MGGTLEGLAALFLILFRGGKPKAEGEITLQRSAVQAFDTYYVDFAFNNTSILIPNRYHLMWVIWRQGNTLHVEATDDIGGWNVIIESAAAPEVLHADFLSDGANLRIRGTAACAGRYYYRVYTPGA